MWEQRGRHPVSMMARLLGVSRSGCYAWLDAGGHTGPLAGLKEVVEAPREGGAFGWHRVKAGLPPEWSDASGCSILKNMRELGIRGFRPRPAKRATVPDLGAPARLGLARRRFRPPVPTAVLCGGIAYLRTGEGWLYLASVVDLSTRMVVGWPFSARMTADICVSAPEMAGRRGHVARQRHIPLGPGEPVHQRATRGVGRRQRRAALRGPDRLLPRQRGGGVALGQPQEGDVPPQDVRDARGGQDGLHRPGRAVLQPLAPALGDRLQAPRRPDGRVPGQDGGDVQERGLPGGVVSEILTHSKIPERPDKAGRLEGDMVVDPGR